MSYGRESNRKLIKMMPILLYGKKEIGTLFVIAIPLLFYQMLLLCSSEDDL
jgi:hypothetical protein